MVIERMVLQKAACACFLGDQQDPPTGIPQRVRKKKARMEDGALETVRKPGRYASLLQTLSLLIRNEAGQRLIEFCQENALIITIGLGMISQILRITSFIKYPYVFWYPTV